jgi:metal transporter CNNM
MTPMQDVFTMSADTILDESMMDTILSQGYSRIPIYAPDNNRNFIGMLLVKILITYDPEDARRVRDFSLATLPETGPKTSCLDIINFFQEGKSHMVLVSDFPGKDKGALGVVTLEDVIEELIGEEIIDESDVFVDVHKAIRRMAPAPQRRFKRDAGGLEPSLTHDSLMNGKEDASETEPLLPGTDSRKQSLSNGAPATTFLIRRKSSNASEPANAIPVRTNTAEMREHLRHLGPSNVASKPRATKYSSVKIKPGVGTIPENQTTTNGTNVPNTPPARSRSVDVTPDANIPPPKSAGKEASDGAAAIRATGGYGTMGGSSPPASRPKAMLRGQSALEASQVAELKAQADAKQADGGLSVSSTTEPPPGIDGDRSRDLKPPEKMVVGSTGSIEGRGQGEGEEADMVSDLAPSRQRSQSRRQARSGSITETEVEVGGLTKVVLETTSSSSDEDEGGGDDAKSGKSGSWMRKKGSGSSKD